MPETNDVTLPRLGYMRSLQPFPQSAYATTHQNYQRSLAAEKIARISGPTNQLYKHVIDPRNTTTSDASANRDLLETVEVIKPEAEKPKQFRLPPLKATFDGANECVSEGSSSSTKSSFRQHNNIIIRKLYGGRLVMIESAASIQRTQASTDAREFAKKRSMRKLK